MILYRPVSLQELALIYDSGMKAFPVGLPQQPIFYPVVDLEYARQTALDWNTKNGQFAGYVTQFKIEEEYIGKFETHAVGGTEFEEFWIPADQMEGFNQHIVGRIKVVEAYFGKKFQGFVPDQFGLQGNKAVEQFTLLSNSYIYKRMDFYLEIKRNHKAVFLNYPFWQKYDFKNPSLKEKILQAIKEAWFASFPQIPLVPPVQEDANPAKQTNSEPSVKPADEKKIARPRPIESAPLAKPVRKDIVPIKPRESHTFVRPIQKDVTPPKRPVPSPLVNPIRDETPPVEPTNSSVFVEPVREQTRPTRQTVPYIIQGTELGLSGNYQEAIEKLSQAIEENPNHIAAHVSLGVACHRVGEDQRAVTCYENALRINPKYAEAHYFRANIFYEAGDVREAIAGYTIAIGLDPTLIEVHLNPIPEDRLTDYIGAPAEIRRIANSAYRILNLNRTLETNPSQANLYKERAAEYSRLGNAEQAIADYSAFLKIQPSDATVLHLRGLAYEWTGQHERALQDYQQAIALDPGLSDVYINRGIAFGREGNFRQAVASLSDAIRLAPQNPDGYFNRGMTFLQQGDFESAIDDFSNVIRLSPNDDAAYYWRGISNEEAGRQRQAIADYRQFLTLSQDPHAKEEIEQKLRQWNDGKQSRISSRAGGAADQQKTGQVEAQQPAPEHDLYGLMAALGERALNSTWFGTGVKCHGESAQDLYAFTNHDRPILGRDLLQLLSGIQQTIEGDFSAYDPDASAHWVFIRAWEGTGFYIETDDRKIKQHVQSRYRWVEEVEGISPPYEGLFVHKEE